MKIAWCGLGKLGLPCALALARYGGHQVAGYDVCPELAKAALFGEGWPHPEQGLPELLSSVIGSEGGSFRIVEPLTQAVQDAEVVFVAVQTPHAPGYDGSQPTPDEPRDFEYGYLVQALRDLAAATQRQAEPLTVAVVSTVLPGTCSRLLAPLIRPPLRLAYTPSFIAMGTTIADFLDPEFRLVGADDDEAYKDVARVWAGLAPGGTVPVLHTSVVTAETIKVAYNAYLGVKLVTANTLMEMCHDLGADVDDVTRAFGMAHQRLMSPAYLSGGMGDGGSCHPRDGLAMSWLARRLGLSFDLFGTMMRARDAQTQWLADLAAEWAALTRFPIVILGKAYKPETNITAGSPALLLADLLGRRDPELLAGHYDPHVDGDDRQPPWHQPAVFVVATKHEVFAELRFAQGSVVIDPWRFLPDQDGVTVVRVGRR